MTSKSQNYSFITTDESEEETEKLSEEIIPHGNRKDYVEIARFDDFDPWILWLSSQDTWSK